MFIENNEINILVVGTVARTGIAGFIMGNTVVNIVQKVTCSLLAVKPKVSYRPSAHTDYCVVRMAVIVRFPCKTR